MCAPMRLADFSYDLLQMYVCRAAFPVVAGAVGSACVQIRMGTADLTHNRPFPRMRQGFQATVSACGLRACIAELKSFLFGMSPCNLVSPLTLALRTLLRDPPQPGMKFADWQGGGSERGGMPGRLKSGTTQTPPLGHSHLMPCPVVLRRSGHRGPGPWSETGFSVAFRALFSSCNCRVCLVSRFKGQGSLHHDPGGQ